MAPLTGLAKHALLVAMVWGFCRGEGDEYGAEVRPRRDEARRGELLEAALQGLSPEEIKEYLLQTLDIDPHAMRRGYYDRPAYESADDQGDEALLERVGRIAMEWINTRLTPRTDEDCEWDWGHWRCDPQCQCRYHYKFGDYWPSRSCRRVPLAERDPFCDPTRGDDISLLERLGLLAVKVAKKTWRFTDEHVLPKTDEECSFAPVRSLEEKGLVCSPYARCAFRYKFGDFHLGRSCRLRSKEDQAQAQAEEWERARRRARRRGGAGEQRRPGGGAGSGSGSGSWGSSSAAAPAPAANERSTGGTSDSEEEEAGGYYYGDDGASYDYDIE